MYTIFMPSCHTPGTEDMNNKPYNGIYKVRLGM
jgi:hypothetical protein